MEIIIKKNGKYLDVKIVEDALEINFGLRNEEECKELALLLLNAATELLQGA